MRLPIFVLAALALAVLVPAAAACSGSQTGTFPAFVYGSALSLESYRAAASLPPDVLAAMPCYCGCGTLERPHRSLQDCFYNPDGGYSDHAATCELCADIVLDVSKEHRGGTDLMSIRILLDSKYSAQGTPTDTALPKEGGLPH